MSVQNHITGKVFAKCTMVVKDEMGIQRLSVGWAIQLTKSLNIKVGNPQNNDAQTLKTKPIKTTEVGGLKCVTDG